MHSTHTKTTRRMQFRELSPHHTVKLAHSVAFDGSAAISAEPYASMQKQCMEILVCALGVTTHGPTSRVSYRQSASFVSATRSLILPTSLQQVPPAFDCNNERKASVQGFQGECKDLVKWRARRRSSRLSRPSLTWMIS